MANSLQQKMKTAQGMWAKARTRAESEPAFGGSEVEDGRYIVTLSDGKLGESQNSGRLQVAWSYVILEGDYKGQTIRSYDGMESEENLVWLGRKLAKLGYDIPEDLEALKPILEEITKKKPTLRIRVKTKGEFQNIYIDQVLTGHEVDDSGTSGDSSSTDDAPAEGEVELQVGATVTFLYKGESKEGEVTEILEADGKVKVRSDKLVYTVTTDKIESVTSVPDAGEDTDVPEEPAVEPAEEDEPEPEPEPARVTRKTPTPAPKKKPVPIKKRR